MGVLNLITDRTENDVAYAKALAAKWKNGTISSEEKAEWFDGLKGGYGVTDLNRVSSAMAYLEKLLNEAGYSLNTYQSFRQNWINEEWFGSADAEIYLKNVCALRNAISLPTNTAMPPNDLSRFTKEEANAIEEILLAIEVSINSMVAVKPRVAQNLMFCGFGVYPLQKREYVRLYTADNLAVYTADGQEVYIKS